MAVKHLKTKFELKFDSILLGIYKYTIDREDIHKHFAYIAMKMRPQYKKPGFRKGHVPLNIIIQEKANDPAFYDEALDHLIKSEIESFLIQNDIKCVKIGFSRIIERNVEIYIWKYPEQWNINHTITKYQVKISDNDIEEKIQNELQISLSNKEINNRSVQIGDVIEIVHIIEGKEFSSKILVSDKHWSINMNINEEYHSFINESVLEDLENHAREYFFSEKTSIVKKIYENITLQINDESAKKAGYQDLNDMKNKITQELENELESYTMMLLQKQSVEYLINNMNELIFDKDAIANEFAAISTNLLKYLHVNNVDNIDDICVQKFNMKFGDILLELEKFCNKKILIRHLLSLYKSYDADGTFNRTQYNQNMNNTMPESHILIEIANLFSHEVKEIKYKELLEILEQNNKSDSLSCLMEKR